MPHIQLPCIMFITELHTSSEHLYTRIKILQHLQSLYVTGPGKTGLIYTKYIYYSTYLLFCKFYAKCVNFIEFLMDFCICDDILDMIQITDKKLLHFKLSKSGQILRINKTCFPRPGHIYYYVAILMWRLIKWIVGEYLKNLPFQLVHSFPCPNRS